MIDIYQSEMSVGASLLFVIGEPQNEHHIQLIHDRIKEGLTTWSTEHCSEDVNTELLNFINSDISPEQTDGNGLVIRYDGKMYVEVLFESTINLFQQALQNFLLMPSTFKLIVHAGPAYQGNGSWILRDASFSLHDLVRILHRGELANILNNNANNQCRIVVSCLAEGEWSDAGLKLHDSGKRFNLSFAQAGTGASQTPPASANDLANYICRMVKYKPSETAMPLSTMVGNIKFRRPTAYLFPAGQGEACLLGVNDFTILLDGGFQQRTCFWDFVRHVDRIDSIVLTSARPGAANGLRAMVRRLVAAQPESAHPALAHCFANEAAKPTHTGSQPQQRHPLLISPFEAANDFISDARRLSLEPHPLHSNMLNLMTKKPEPVTLYQKIGVGRFDMYVLNPAKDAKELTDFTTNFKKLMAHQVSGYSLKPGSNGAFPIPLTDQCSAAILLIWQPANEREPIVRVLYSGSCPQERIFQGLDKLKHLDCLHYRSCNHAFLAQPASKRAMLSGAPHAAPKTGHPKSLDLKPKPYVVGAGKTQNGGSVQNGKAKIDSPASGAQNGHSPPSQTATPSATQKWSPMTSEAMAPSPLTLLVAANDDHEEITTRAIAHENNGNGDVFAQDEAGGETADKGSPSQHLNPDAPEFVPRRVSLDVPVGINIIPPSPRPPGADESFDENCIAKMIGSTSAKPSAESAVDVGTSQGNVQLPAKASEDGAAKTIDDLKKEWGSPLGLPPVQENGDVKAKPASTSKKQSTLAQESGKKETSSTSKAKVPPSKSIPQQTKQTTDAKVGLKSSKSVDQNTSLASKSAPKKPVVPTSKSSAPEKSTAPKPVRLSLSKTAPISSKPAIITTVSAGGKKTGSAGTGPIYYVDLAYIPHNGNPFYFSADFVRNIRSKYYVLSAAQPTTDCLEALLAGKRAWSAPDDATTLVPTNDSEALGLWLAQRRDELGAESVTVAPSCARCTLNLEERQEAMCAAYRLEL